MAKTSIAAQGQIWYVYPEVDNEIKTNKMKKIRPWLIISPDEANYTSSGYIGVPITHNATFNNGFKIEIECPTKPGKPFDKSWIITYKPRTIDENELASYIGTASKELVQECIDYLNRYLCGDLNNQIEAFYPIIEYADPIIEYDNIIDKSLDDLEQISEPIEANKVTDINQCIEKKKEDTLLEKYKMKYPNTKFLFIYKDIKDSYKILEYLQLYVHDRKKFNKKFNVTNKTSFKLKKELNNYYSFLLDNLIEKCI